MKKSKGSSFNSVTTNLKNNISNVSIMTMNKLLKHNACHIHPNVTDCLVKEQAIQEVSLRMRHLRVLNLRYLSLESERPDKQTFI